MTLDDIIVIAGPSFHVDLPAIDARHPVHYSRRLSIFRCASDADLEAQITSLKCGLEVLVRKCPILSGSVTPRSEDAPQSEDKDWATIAPGQGVELVVRDLRGTLPSFEDLEARNFAVAALPYDLLVPVPQNIGNNQVFAACKMQLSAIKGGTIIAFAMSHSVADGSGNNEIMRILSEEVATVRRDFTTSTSPSSAVGLDREVLRCMTSETHLRLEDHPAFQRGIGLKPQPQQHLFAPQSAEIPCILQISSDALIKLKADASSNGLTISTHDAMSALVWRSVALIRTRRTKLNDLEFVTGHFYMPSDARRYLNLPAAYIGNAVYQLTASLDLAKLLSEQGLKYAAQAIRRAITAVKPELVQSYMAHIRHEWLDWAFLEDYGTTGVAMGTDWTSGVLYEHDWGSNFGHMIRFRYPDEPATCILPRLPDGSAEIQVSVQAGEMALLKSEECFGKYLA